MSSGIIMSDADSVDLGVASGKAYRLEVVAWCLPGSNVASIFEKL